VYPGQSRPAEGQSYPWPTADESSFARAGFSAPAPAAPAPATPVAATPVSGGPDGARLTQGVNGHLDYVSQLANQLGVTDPVESYLTPAIGAWSDLHTEAGRWRAAAATATQVTSTLTRPLGGLDAAWQGADANSFLDYMQRIGLAGNDLADAMNGMADALDRTADGLRSIVKELVDLLTDTAEQASDAMSVPVSGETRARQYLDELNQPSSQLYESVREVLDAFVRMCDGVQGAPGTSAMAHSMPSSAWAPPAAQPPPQHLTRQPGSRPTPPRPAPLQPTTPHPTTPPTTQPVAAQPVAAQPAAQHAAQPTAHHAAQPAAQLGGGRGASAAGLSGGGAADSVSASPQQRGQGATGGIAQTDPNSALSEQHTGTAAAGGTAAAAQSGQGQAGMAGGMGMGGMGGMRGGQGGGDQEHKSKIRLSGDIRDVLGKPGKTAPPVIGEE
jgi:uncharacterized protein YukE